MLSGDPLLNQFAQQVKNEQMDFLDARRFLRWNHNRDIRQPDEFAPVATQYANAVHPELVCCLESLYDVVRAAARANSDQYVSRLPKSLYLAAKDLIICHIIGPSREENSVSRQRERGQRPPIG